MTLTLAQKEDGDRILALYRACAGHKGCTWNAFYPTQEDIDIDLSQGALYALRAEDGQLIGTVSAGYEREMDDVCPWTAGRAPCEIARLGVQPALQGEGLGGSLLRLLLDTLRARGFDRARLLVSPGNAAACALYARAGFVKAGEADLYDQHWHCLEKAL